MFKLSINHNLPRKKANWSRLNRLFSWHPFVTKNMYPLNVNFTNFLDFKNDKFTNIYFWFRMFELNWQGWDPPHTPRLAWATSIFSISLPTRHNSFWSWSTVAVPSQIRQWRHRPRCQIHGPSTDATTRELRGLLRELLSGSEVVIPQGVPGTACWRCRQPNFGGPHHQPLLEVQAT